MEILGIDEQFLEFVLVPPLARSYSPVEISHSRARNLYDNAERFRMEIRGIAIMENYNENLSAIFSCYETYF
jgi:hypothetical protein